MEVDGDATNNDPVVTMKQTTTGAMDVDGDTHNDPVIELQKITALAFCRQSSIKIHT